MFPELGHVPQEEDPVATAAVNGFSVRRSVKAGQGAAACCPTAPGQRPKR